MVDVNEVSQNAVRKRALELRAKFEAAGAQVVDPPILQPADTLLDLYGEDIRARAYVTSDALRGEQMLRPDFTVPVVQMHMEHGADPIRYTYAGEVFRRQEHDPERASEYLQVGYEVFERDDAAAADAEVFALVHGCIGHLDLRAAMGDIGILTAAVAGLNTTERRKAALMRHIWRPRRFRALLDRFSGRSPMSPSRKALLALSDPMATIKGMIGKRSKAEIASRVQALHDDAGTAPIPAAQASALDVLLTLRQTLPNAVERLRDLAVDMPAIAPAIARLEARSVALQTRGIDVTHLEFDANYGRTSMEYYDGFVFGLYAAGRPDLPELASGGRYDALTRRLGQGDEIPAVGAVLRPGIITALEAQA